MEDGRIVIAGSNFGSRPGFPDEPGPQVAIYNPATNAWTKMIEDYELNKSRYYPSVYRLTDGRIGTFGGQATQSPATFVDEPYEINPNKLTLLAAWQMPVATGDFLNYPHLFPVSSTELFFAGPGRHNGLGGNGGATTTRHSISTWRIRPLIPLISAGSANCGAAPASCIGQEGFSRQAASRRWTRTMAGAA